MRFELRGDMHLAVGIPIPSAGVAYFEIVSLGDLEDTLGALGVSLLGASVVTTLAGAGIGWWASRRALRPLAGVSTAATALAAGRLDTRLESSDDPDLRPIAESFNDMAQALQDRIESDARFASDVSHELRSPLMTLAASIEVMDNQRDELPERSRAALDLMVADIDRFRQLVEDLLEISRFDAGVVRLELEEVHLAELVMQAVSHSTDADVPVDLDAELAGVVVQADKRRIVRVHRQPPRQRRQVRRRRHQRVAAPGRRRRADRRRGSRRGRARGGPRGDLRPVQPRRRRRPARQQRRRRPRAWRSSPST